MKSYHVARSACSVGIQYLLFDGLMMEKESTPTFIIIIIIIIMVISKCYFSGELIALS